MTKKRNHKSIDERLDPATHVDQLVGSSKLKNELRAALENNKQLIKQVGYWRDRADFQKKLVVPTANRIKLSASSGDGESVAGLILSDTHFEEQVTPSKLNGLNHYNLEIAEKRWNNVINGAAQLLDDFRRRTRINTLIVGLLGDFISGHIHPELIETCLLHPLAACRFASGLIASGLKTLGHIQGIERIVVVTAVGNHSRTTQKMHISTETENSYEQDMYYRLAEAFSGDKKFEWHIPDGQMAFADVYGHVCRFQHGHAFKYNGGIGGIAVPVQKKTDKWNAREIKADYDFFGHHHEYNLIQHRIISNASLIGYNQFARWIGAGFQQPMQTVFVIHRQRGMTYCDPVFGETGFPGKRKPSGIVKVR